jgi:hypothetical protein
VSAMPLEMKRCRLCGSFAFQSYSPNRDTFQVYCFNEFSTETWDCDAPKGPECSTSDESVRLWNELQVPEERECDDTFSIKQV